MDAVNVEGLTVEERDLVTRFVALLRESRAKREAREELGRMWRQFAALPDALDQAEADALALEAVEAARGRGT